MPLILAIEPDKRQGSQLTALVKGLHAELVLRTNAGEAIAALHGRVPDLVLTTSLISPRDDAALGAHLRELGSAAAHVQTVTIPLLGSAAPTRAKGGMLAALRREKPQAPMTDGCEPDVFAEQVRQYLATAEEQKAVAATRVAAADEFLTPAAEPELVASEPEPVAFEPEPVALEAAPAAFEPEVMEAAPSGQESPAPVVELAAVEPEPAPIEEPPVVAEVEMEAAAPDDFAADEPAGLPLSQLLQLVSDAAPVFDAPVLAAPVVEAITDEVAVEPIAEPLFEPEPVIEVAPVIDLAPELEATPTDSFDDLYLDPAAAEALEELSRLAPAASLADGIPAEAPVPIVEMRSFQSLDAIARELAAGPAQRLESLDELAGMFAATPEAPAPPTPVAPVADFSAPMHGEKSLFASLFAEPAPPRPSKPVDVPDIDASLFASPAAAPVIAFEAPAPTMAVEPEPIPIAEPEPVLREVTVAPAVEEAVVEEVVVEEVVVDEAPVEAAAVETSEDEFITFEPVVFEPVVNEAAEVTATPAFDDEIALDVDAFTFTPPPPAPAPAVAAEPERFSFTLVEGFGDAMNDFEVPSLATVAAGLGLGEHLPLDPYASKPAPAPAAVREAVSQPAAAPTLDAEALTLIGDAARKVSLDALVIQDFERGLNQPRPKKLKKKVHAGATQVPAAAAPPAKPARRPVQDEWGMFDPEQCGFAALDEEEGSEKRPTTGSRTRVISY